MSVTATVTVSGPTAVVRKLEMFGNWILASGQWNDQGEWMDEVIIGRNYFTNPVTVTSISITENT